MIQRYNSLLFLVVAMVCISPRKSNAAVVRDSTVVVPENRDTVVAYPIPPVEYDIVQNRQTRSYQAMTEEKIRHEEDLMAEKRRWDEEYWSRRPSRSLPGSNVSVGGIPLEDGVSPSGARTYSIPITVAPDAKFPPSITLSYNSQAGEGLAGYGWDVGGISRISLINRNIYYHGRPETALSCNPDAVFALDGNPLVQNADTATMAEYPLVTASGHIVAKKMTNAGGFVTGFQVRYPNGVKATYSLGYNVQYNFPSYPVSEMEDIDGNKVTFSYLSDSLNGNYRISRIYYNYDTSDYALSRIEFNYVSTQDYAIRYYAGKEVYQSYLLSSVVSNNQGHVLADYPLRHISRDNVHLLGQIGCNNGIDSLPPLNFEYGDPNYWQGAANAKLVLEENYQYLNTSSTNPDNVYRRGKFIRNSYNDGLIIYPDLPNYVRGNPQQNQPPFISGYHPNQAILFVPCLGEGETIQVDSSIVAGNGFQTIEAVDVDGNGLDELVRVNFYRTVGSKTQLEVTVFKCLDTGIPVYSTSFKVLVNGTFTSGNVLCPYRRSYYWGDFTGNGTAQLLTIAYNSNGYGTTQTCYAALIDLNSHIVLSDQVLFDYSLTDTRNVLVMDIDSDGRSDLCHAHANGFDVLRVSSSNTFSVEQSFSFPDATVFSREHTCFTDLNADGYLDIMCPSGTSGIFQNWYRYAYTGESISMDLINLGSVEAVGQYMFIDVNQDSYPDLVKVTTSSVGVRLNLNGRSFGAFRLSDITVSDAKGIVPCNVIDYGTPCGFIKVEGNYIGLFKYQSLSPRIRYLSESEDSYGKHLHSTYQYLPNHSSFWTSSSCYPDSTAGYAKRTLPIYILRDETGVLSEGGCYKNRSYAYNDAVVHSQGLGFCGFAQIKVYDNMPSYYMMTDMHYDPERRGVLTRVLTRDGYYNSSPLVSSQENTYDSHWTAYGKLNPRLTQSVVTDALHGITTTTSYSYGAYDYPLQVYSSKTLGSGSTPQTERLQRTYEHSTASNKYVLGIVKEESVIKELDGAGDYSWKERTVTTYDSKYHPLTRKEYVGRYGAQSDATNLVSEARWTYDAYGNVLSEEKAPYGTSGFIGDTYTYDSDGHHLTSQTNALGQTTTYSGYNHWGKPSSSMDFRGHVTSYQYDSWGNLTRSTYPDGGETETIASWGGTGRYYLTKTITGAPDEVTHFDGICRERRSGQKRFNGQWQYVDKEYDLQGHVSRVSLPFRGQSATYWNVYAYDHFGRPVSVTEASGKVISWTYNGTSTTTVKDGITSTSTTDAGGNVVSITDGGGTITYTLRDDGQPTCVTAPGNVNTTFTYDNYGRRTKIVDPSAGTRTDNYVWNSGGSSMVVHTNSNGSVTTFRDVYGRTSLVTRAGEYNTGYIFNNDGLVSSEQSTNGAEKYFSYDSLGRVCSVRENVPDGKFLLRNFSYLPGSVLGRVSYSNQDGPIVDEVYTYANGHLQSVTTDGGLTVWSLTSENALGQPTSVMTAGVSRCYGYTNYGIPSWRDMDDGDLQGFWYQFDVATGNLTQRVNQVYDVSETFGYDTLNRLSSMGNRQVGYAANGNILSLGGVGTMAYESASHPYQVTTLTPSGPYLVPRREQHISYTSFDRPSTITEGGKQAAFTYNGDGDRVKMAVTDSTGNVLTRYYAGGRYEYDLTPGGTKERLYLGGDAYSAPLVLQRVNNGIWTAYNIGRDYLGSVTHIATAAGALVAEYSYDPWGRLRDPETQAIYAAGSDPDLFLGRGFTGHEHLPWFGLINMNARLYDPILGRFLSPDPYVQAPDFTQDFNRYSYALNNPLKYKDESGEFFTGTILTASLRLPIAIVKGVIAPFFLGFAEPLKAGQMVNQAWTEYGQRVANAFKIDLGLFMTDTDLSPDERRLSFVSRLTWELPQTELGLIVSHFRNNFWETNIEYYHGATLVNRDNPAITGWGMTIGNYINSVNLKPDPKTDYIFAHEYGHTKQSTILGPLYISFVGIPSLAGAFCDSELGISDHDREVYEVWANQLSYNYFDRHGYSDITSNWSPFNSRTQNPDWFFGLTMFYYAVQVIAALFIIF